MRAALTIARFALRESLRRRVFGIVGVLTLGFLGLYALGTSQVFETTGAGGFDGTPVEAEVVAGATLLGLACFATLFLGAVLAVFLTLGAVRGDAERGLLQPVLVRGVSRGSYLLGRWLAAASVCAVYVAVVFLLAAAITYVTGGWWPDRVVRPALGLAFAVAVLAALSLAASVVLGTAANGIAIFMLFGAGLVAGLLGQIGEALGSVTLGRVAEVTSWALPFEALYQAALSGLTADTVGFNRFAIDLGPFGGAEPGGPLLWLFALAYLAGVGAAARWLFARRDL
jgi:ABC-type transport system involved in multi-copper enzyme maturation permease subunit